MARREKVAEASIRGYGEAEIARSLSVTKSCVSLDLIWLRQKWLEKAIDKAPEWKAFLIQGQLKVIRDCWAAWERSKKREDDGNTKYLDSIHKAQAELAKLTGAYEPFQTRIVDEQGKDILSRLVDSLSVEELRTYDATFKKLEAIEVENRQAKVIDVVSTPAVDDTDKPKSKPGSNGHASGNGDGKPTV